VSLLRCKSWVLGILSPVSCSERLLFCHMDVLTALQPEQWRLGKFSCCRSHALWTNVKW
jgi:hypothetical protein